MAHPGGGSQLLDTGLQDPVGRPGRIGRYVSLNSHKLGAWNPRAQAHVARPVKVTDLSVWIAEAPLTASVAAENAVAIIIGGPAPRTGKRRLGRTGRVG